MFSKLNAILNGGRETKEDEKQKRMNEEYLEWERAKHEEYKPKILESELKMAGLYCPLASSNCIGIKCVHYMPSRLKTARIWDDCNQGFYEFFNARCKLWKK